MVTTEDGEHPFFSHSSTAQNKGERDIDHNSKASFSLPLSSKKLRPKTCKQSPFQERKITADHPLLSLSRVVADSRKHKPPYLHQHSQDPSMDESETYPKDYYRENGARTLSSSSSSNATTSIQVTALDGLVNVNSLFTIAVFVGLSISTPDQHSLENPGTCDAGIDVYKKLLVFEVVSFSFFLFSSLVAQGLKLAINLLNSKDVEEAIRAHINIKVLRFGMVSSAVGSVMGCLFLMLSMICVIEIRLGMLSCGSKSAVRATSALVVLVSSALVAYISTAVYAFLH